MKDIVNFCYEAGNLKNVDRSGWWLLGKKDPETVAEHSFRAGLIGYLLGKMEGADANKVCVMALMQDFPEARINDMHKLGQRYVDFKPIEKKCLVEQVSKLPEEIGSEIIEYFDEYHKDGSTEGVLARDADLLECAFQAREYATTGIDTSDWLKNTESLLKSETAKKMFAELMKTSPHDWWKGLKKIER